MAVMTIKSTYSLDPATVRALEDLARRWGVSKSEALRRVIRAAASDRSPAAIEALDALQRSLSLSPNKARAWAQRSRAERKASSARGRVGRK